MSNFEITNPANGETLASISGDTPDSVRAKFERARAASAAWRATPLATRCAAIEKWSSLLSENIESLSKILSQEMGKPIGQARGEINANAGRVQFFLENVDKHMRMERRSDDSNTEEFVSYEPLGVIANISAWNFPYFVGTNVIVPALLTGNAVLYKPSEFTTLTGKEIERYMHQAGVPEDIFIGVYGKGDIGEALLKQDLDGGFFTGSYATGKKISEQLAGRLIPLQLELGGKDPIYVADDVDIESAAAGIADGAFYNNGQSCCSVERIYVNEAIADKFVASFVQSVKGMKVGDPLEEDTYIGPLTRKAQVDILKAQVADAQSKGAEIAFGGKPLEGNYFEPTVLTNVTNEMKVMREESFGPIIGIAVVSDDAEAISLMNDTEYGLTSGVFTKSRERAEGILSQLNSGSVYWNCCDRVSPNLPWSGRNNSGIGSTLGVEGITAFMKPKAWHMRAAG